MELDGARIEHGHACVRILHYRKKRRIGLIHWSVHRIEVASSNPCRVEVEAEDEVHGLVDYQVTFHHNGGF
jgi:hypothetical protein